MVPYFTGGNHVVFTSRDSERCARYVVGLAFHVEGVFALPGGQLSVQSLCRLQMPIYGNSSAIWPFVTKMPSGIPGLVCIL